MVVEKLTQKVSNMLDEIGDVNILIRRLTPTQETLNRIHERMDSVYGVLKQLEKGVTLDEKKLEVLQMQTGTVRAGLESQTQILKDELSSAKRTTDSLVSSFRAHSAGMEKAMSEVNVKLQKVADGLDRLGTSYRQSCDDAMKRWDAFNLGRERVFWTRFVCAGLLVGILLILLFHLH